MTQDRRYLISIREWDPYAGEGGDWIWKTFSDGFFTEATLNVVEESLMHAEKTYAIGEVKGRDV